MPQKKLQEKKSLLDVSISFKGVNLTQKLVFARYLAIMLKSGLTITEALDIIHDQASGKFKNVVGRIIKSVQSGNPLSTALKAFPSIFSNLFVSTAMAGEASGTLEKNLNNLSEQLKAEKELKTKIKSAMVYPVIVLVATFFLGLAMAFFVLPKITPLFEGFGMELPITTRMLIWVSKTVQNHGIRLLVSIVSVFFFFFWLVRQRFSHPVTHFIILHTPFVKNISRNANLANFSKTLGTLLKSGLTIDRSLEITKNTASNYYYSKCLCNISRRVSQGAKLSENVVMYEKYFPKLVSSMIRVGERSGNLEESLLYVAEFYEMEVDSATKALSTAIEPILLIGIGLTVGGMAMSIIAPIYQITGSV